MFILLRVRKDNKKHLCPPKTFLKHFKSDIVRRSLSFFPVLFGPSCVEFCPISAWSRERDDQARFVMSPFKRGRRTGGGSPPRDLPVAKLAAGVSLSCGCAAFKRGSDLLHLTEYVLRVFVLINGASQLTTTKVPRYSKLGYLVYIGCLMYLSNSVFLNLFRLVTERVQMSNGTWTAFPHPYTVWRSPPLDFFFFLFRSEFFFIPHYLPGRATKGGNSVFRRREKFSQRPWEQPRFGTRAPASGYRRRSRGAGPPAGCGDARRSPLQPSGLRARLRAAAPSRALRWTSGNRLRNMQGADGIEQEGKDPSSPGERRVSKALFCSLPWVRDGELIRLVHRWTPASWCDAAEPLSRWLFPCFWSNWWFLLDDSNLEWRPRHNWFVGNVLACLTK